MIEAAWSKGPSRRRALTAPRAMASGVLISPAMRTSTAEFSSRLPITSVTGGFVPTREWPKSPLAKPPSQCVYCLTAGSSRLSCLRSAASESGVAVRPRIARAVSPGSVCVAAKTTIETRNSVTMPRTIRRRMKPGIPRGCSRANVPATAAAPELTMPTLRRRVVFVQARTSG